MDIQHMTETIRETNIANGWRNRPSDDVAYQLAQLALIHSEVSEAVEAIRDDEPTLYTDEKGKPCGIASELADVIIRCLDMSDICDIPIEEALKIKLEYNKTRGYRHGGKKA